MKQVREGAIKYVREQVTDADAVAVLTVTNSLQMVQPFTQDKAKLIAALENFGTNPDSKNFEQKDLAGNIDSIRDFLNKSDPALTTGITSPAGGAAALRVMIAQRVLQQFIRLRTALSLQQSRPILAALAAIAEGLRPIPGKKTLVLFSQGFVTPAVLDWQVQSTIDIANRANVAIYIIDSAGLRASAPTSGAPVPATPLAGVSAITTQEQRIRGVGGETVFDNVRQEGQSREYDILYRISGDTGGKLFQRQQRHRSGARAHQSGDSLAIHARISQHESKLRRHFSQSENRSAQARCADHFTFRLLCYLAGRDRSAVAC